MVQDSQHTNFKPNKSLQRNLPRKVSTNNTLLPLSQINCPLLIVQSHKRNELVRYLHDYLKKNDHESANRKRRVNRKLSHVGQNNNNAEGRTVNIPLEDCFSLRLTKAKNDGNHWVEKAKKRKAMDEKIHLKKQEEERMADLKAMPKAAQWRQLQVYPLARTGLLTALETPKPLTTTPPPPASLTINAIIVKGEKEKSLFHVNLIWNLDTPTGEKEKSLFHVNMALPTVVVYILLPNPSGEEWYPNPVL